MSSRDRDTKSFQDKLKVFFKKGPSAPLPTVNELVVSAELERELRADAAPARRLRALRDLGDRARVTRIQQGGVERLWALTRDLLEDGTAEHRHTALWFLRCLAEGQECAVMRTLLFRHLQDTHARHAPDDAPHRLALLATLTDKGKNIECFEEQIGAYLLEYMRTASETGAALSELLALVINVVKYNATYLDEHIVHGIVEYACHLCAYSAESAAVVSALALLEAVVAYSLLPRAALPAFVSALCRAVNLERHCQTSWKLMRSVLGADLGHAALQELVALPGAAADAGVVRGAVFYINMALWGPRRVPSLRVSLLAVLPAFLQAVSSDQPVVTYEVIQAIQSLVTRAPPEALCAAWDVLLLVLHHALEHDRSLDPPNELIHSRLHALLTSIEQLHEAGQFTGDADQLLDLIECCAHDRPEASALRLITLRCAALGPARADWLAAAHALADKFVRREPRLAVRLHALAQLLALVKRHRFAYEEEVVLGVGVGLLGACGAAGEAALRGAAARALAELAVLAAGDASTDLVDLLEKVRGRGLLGACGAAGEAALRGAAARALAELAVLAAGDASTDLVDLLEKVRGRGLLGACGAAGEAALRGAAARALAELAVLAAGDASTDLVDLLEKVRGRGLLGACGAAGEAALRGAAARALAELAVLAAGDASTDLVDLLEKVRGRGLLGACGAAGEAALRGAAARALAELAVLAAGDASTDLVDLLEKVRGRGLLGACGAAGEAALRGAAARALAELAVLAAGDASTDLVDLLEKVRGRGLLGACGAAGEARALAELAVLAAGDASTDLVDLLEKVRGRGLLGACGAAGEARALAELAVLAAGDASTDLVDLLEKVRGRGLLGACGAAGEARALAELAVLAAGDASTDLVDLLEKVRGRGLLGACGAAGEARALAELAVLAAGDASTDLVDLLEKVRGRGLLGACGAAGEARALAELAVLAAGDASTDLVDLLEKVRGRGLLGACGAAGEARALAELAVLAAGDASTDLVDLLEKVRGRGLLGACGAAGEARALAELAVLAAGDASTDLVDLLEKVRGRGLLGACGAAGEARALAELAVLAAGDASTDLVDLLEKVRGRGLLGACGAAGEARALAELAVLAAGDASTDLVDLLEKIMNRPFETEEPGESDPEPDLTDVTLAVSGLLDVFHAKLLRAPAAHAARACLVLLDHLDHTLAHPRYTQQHAPCRRKILDMIFGLRANAFNCVGFCYDASGAPVYGAAARHIKPLCSPSLLAEPLAARGQTHPPAKDLAPGTCILPVGRCARIVTLALNREREWSVLQHILKALPALLQARALCVGRRAVDLDLLANTLCAMVSERSLGLPDGLRCGGGKVLVSEFHNAVLPSLGALAPYHAFLEPHTQQRVVRCLLRFGMVLRTPAPYLAALTTFTLEARDTMVKLLPEVLLDLSKVSDTKLIAGPMLEFLSTLTRLPRVFASFVEDQYMSVFAILLPYTNPSRYNHYVVSLAHHVVAAWFLKCRLSYRRNFVRFIIHGLHNYIIMPFEEQLHNYKVHSAPANEDSSNRKRSSSLGSRGVSAAPLAAGASRPTAASASAAFHVELTETCVDLLARYTASPCSVKPHRSDAAEWMFSGGQSQTWLVGHKLVTITTAGCAMNSLKQGMCDRCATLCRQHAESAASPLPPLAPPPDDAPAQMPNDGSHNQQNHNNLQVSQNPPEIKRYSKHSLQHSRSAETSASSSLSADARPEPSSAVPSRQNSAEYNPIVEALNNFTQRFEKISKEVDTEEAAWSRVGELAAAGACPCWCADWAEIHVRSPSGDVAWLMRVQNQMGWENQSECSLQEVLALLAPAPPSSASSGVGDDRTNNASESESRSRSGSSASQAAHAQDLHKSSSDSVVASGERRAPHAASHCIGPPQPASNAPRMSTQPINIPGSPVRGARAKHDDDMLLYVPEGKSRHPVRRSNSSPEMSSWKLPQEPPSPRAPPTPEPDLDLMLLPAEPASSTSMSLHASKKAAKKSDMRVSCEAIPEEMSGSSPLALAHPPSHTPKQQQQQQQHTPQHPHLMTYNSDPVPPAGSGSVPEAAPAPQHPLQKVASDSIVQGVSSAGAAGAHAHKPPAAPRAAHGAHGAHAAHTQPQAAGSVRANDDLPPLSRSKRSNTISVMSPTRRHREQSVSSRSTTTSGASSGGAAGSAGGGVTPSFVLLQLYHKMSTYPITPPVPGEAPCAQNPLAERPLLVAGVQHERTIKNLDRVPPIETYKVGVLYVGPGQQDNEVLILKNEYGSVRYAEFLGQLGTLVSLAGSGCGLLEGGAQPALFLNLEQGGKDGRYTYVWHDDIMQVLFHVATAMPVSAADPTCNEKRKYIGNDYVSIVYNDSGGDFSIHTIKGQFNLCIVVVEPCSHGLHRVLIKTKDERIRSKFLPHLEHSALVVSDHCAAPLARQLALHCALASHISQSLSLGGGAAPYASNSLERLRHIKRLRRRVEDERLAAAARAPKPYAPQGDTARRVAMDDFNDYT